MSIILVVMGNAKLSEFMQTELKNFDMLFQCKIKVDKHVSKKNSRKIMRNAKGGYFIGKSDELIAYEAHLSIKLRQAANRASIFGPIEGPLWVIFHFIFSEDKFFTKQGVVKKTLPDLSNLYELPQDCLEKAKVIYNDNQIWSHDLSRRRVGEETELALYLFRFNEHGLTNDTMKKAF